MVQVTKTTITPASPKEAVIARFKEVYTPPFRYIQAGQFIEDAHGHMVADIRGWGYLQRFTDGEVIQDKIGETLTELLNSATTY